jgi:uncharacterized protein YjaG (DUF416 family)
MMDDSAHVTAPKCEKLVTLRNSIERLVAEIVKRDLERMENLKLVIQKIEESQNGVAKDRDH